MCTYALETSKVQVIHLRDETVERLVSFSQYHDLRRRGWRKSPGIGMTVFCCFSGICFLNILLWFPMYTEKDGGTEPKRKAGKKERKK